MSVLFLLSSDNEPLVSVIVLTYNQEQTVSRTLDSILAQKVDFAYEVIIGEDASPSDNTRAVCEAYAAKYPDVIRLMPKAPNKGLLRNYVDCVRACRGKYIAACAGDDWWHKDDKLQMQVDYLESHSDTVLVYTNYDIFKPSRNKTICRALPAESLDTTGMIDKLMRGFFLPPLTIMYRKSALQYINFEMFIECGYMAEDLPMFLEFSLYGDFACIDVSTATYRTEAGSISHFNDSEKLLAFVSSLRQIKTNFIEAHPGACLMSVEDVEQMYNDATFVYGFSLCDRALVKEYAKKVNHWSAKNRIKLAICKITPLWLAYVSIKKRCR